MTKQLIKNKMSKKNKIDLDFEKYKIDENFYDGDKMLDDILGKVGTKKREKNRQKAMQVFQAEQLMYARKEAGLTQQQVADTMGVDKGYISRIERGLTNPTTSVFYRFVSAIGKRVEIV